MVMNFFIRCAYLGVKERSGRSVLDLGCPHGPGGPCCSEIQYISLGSRKSMRILGTCPLGPGGPWES